MLMSMKINIILHFSLICGLIDSNLALLSDTKSVPALVPTGQLVNVPSDPMGTVDGATNGDVKAVIYEMWGRGSSLEEITSSTDVARGGAQAVAAQAPIGAAFQQEITVLRAAVQTAQVVEPITAFDIRSFPLTFIQALRFILNDLKKAKQCKSCTITYISLIIDFAFDSLQASTEAIQNYHDTGSNNVFSSTELQSALKLLLNYLLDLLNDQITLLLQMSQKIMPTALSVSCDTLESSAGNLFLDANRVELASLNLTLISLDKYP